MKNRFWLLCALGCGSEPELASSGLREVPDVGFTPLAAPDAGVPDAVTMDVANLVREPANWFATRVVSFEPGACAGFGKERFPDIVLGPPEGGGALFGGVDVLSLGAQGSITLSFEQNPIVDGPGVDFVVFENAFYAGGVVTEPYADPAEVSVSADGVAWTIFPCVASKYPYGACTGWTPVYSASNNGIRATDRERAGGEAFDIAQLGLNEVHFVRIVDKGSRPCTPGETTNGFDLDAIASLHRKNP
jgi:hypothetical protein